ncbi:MAG: response regulator transcription factor [Pedobacter sp.]|nr:MAG: response regulator transcription factor [Pedobacter sp.]
MNILIADDIKIYRLAVKSYIHKLWPDAVVYEASNMDAVVEDVFDVEYDLLILDINMPGSDQLEDFVSQAVKYTKVIIFSEYNHDNPRAKKLIDLGADAFLSKSALEEEVISTLLFVFSEN